MVVPHQEVMHVREVDQRLGRALRRVSTEPEVRSVLGVDPVQVLADDPGVVVSGLKVVFPALRGIEVLASVGGKVVEHAVVVRVEAREDRGPAGAAERCCYERLGVGRSVVRQDPPRSRHDVRGVVTLIVGNDQQDVGAAPVTMSLRGAPAPRDDPPGRPRLAVDLDPLVDVLDAAGAGDGGQRHRCGDQSGDRNRRRCTEPSAHPHGRDRIGAA